MPWRIESYKPKTCVSILSDLLNKYHKLRFSDAITLIKNCPNINQMSDDEINYYVNKFIQKAAV